VAYTATSIIALPYQATVLPLSDTLRFTDFKLVSSTESASSNGIIYASHANSAVQTTSMSFGIPAGITGISSIVLQVRHVNNGDLYLSFAFALNTNGATQVTDSIALAPYTVSGTTGGNRGFNITIPPSAYDALTPVSGDLMGIEITRDSVNASDTFEDVMQISQVIITYTT